MPHIINNPYPSGSHWGLSSRHRLDKNHFNSLSQGHKVECTPAKVVIPAEVAVQEKAREVNLLQSIAAAFNEIVQNYKSYKPY